MARLVVAIGNPGSRYAWTRHNIGFLLVDQLVVEFQASSFKDTPKCFSLSAKLDLPSGPVIFIKPKTYVNLSGKAVRSAKDYYGVSLDQILVLADDVNRKFGDVRLRESAGSGGHNGVKSITHALGSNGYWQLRLGIGKPSVVSQELSDFVLSPFSEMEKVQMSTMFAEATRLFSSWCGVI
ncbi:peptidyl-tRNA hydrolase [Chlamydia ibidis]|uniref:Peptidyl-tRNA hydrolase n=2 Tax=Chlamydia ibidis TaxID=1405396 RepID=S7KFA1_9CHLA|nr:aminoacyl-tRNA hydrolase [Chlamydia ibidis]EPP34846.1 peptidyl-tRNA hydrolase [Chlamydia ibidis]EQM62368.1 peptidyl-tRNA hydrolase [Chlamydia ibidis 10-1398/6]